MAGHSKWANIQHRKNKQDAKRAKIFTKLIREITVAAKLGGGDPAGNPRLRDAITKALSANMTRDTIDRAIKRGAGNAEGENYEAITYEGYGVAGVAVMVECLSDNRNRTVSEVRHVFTKCGGNLGTDGSVSYLFTKKGQLVVQPPVDVDKVMEVAIETGADDIVTNDDGSVEVTTTPEQFQAVKEAFEQNNFQLAQAEVGLVPSNYITISDKETAQKMMKLIDMLEDLDDVQHVYSNADFTDEVLKELE